MSKYRMMDLTRNLQFRIQTSNNETFVAFVDNRNQDYDNIGALYYVVAVVLIYGLSIVMMIASHIRKNKQDSQLRSYLKEMAALRKKNRRELLIEKMTDIASKTNSTSPTIKPKVATPIVSRCSENETSRYGGRLPTETDDDSRDFLLLSKTSNSYSDMDDSVFQLPNDYCIEIPKTDSSPLTPVTPKTLTPKLPIKHDGKPLFQIQVINENAPL